MAMRVYKTRYQGFAMQIGVACFGVGEPLDLILRADSDDLPLPDGNGFCTVNAP